VAHRLRAVGAERSRGGKDARPRDCVTPEVVERALIVEERTAGRDTQSTRLPFGASVDEQIGVVTSLPREARAPVLRGTIGVTPRARPRTSQRKV